MDTRRALGLSQSAFAAVINTPLRTLQEWEQGRSQPVGAVVKLCQLLRANPQLAEVS
jgi:putative transcriptional regulator